MAVDRSWRSRDGRWLVDLVVDEPGVVARVWDEGELAAELPSLGELDRWLAAHAGASVAQLWPVPEVEDPWAE